MTTKISVMGRDPPVSDVIKGFFVGTKPCPKRLIGISGVISYYG